MSWNLYEPVSFKLEFFVVIFLSVPIQRTSPWAQVVEVAMERGHVEAVVGLALLVQGLLLPMHLLRQQHPVESKKGAGLTGM